MQGSESSANRVRFRNLYLATSLLAAPFGILVATADEVPARTIHADIKGIQGNDGEIACAFFHSADGFPVAPSPKAAVTVTAPIRDEGARCVFPDAAPGRYAIAAIHDANGNGDLDRNWLGIPTEGYGFSENARARFGAPSFHVASFPFDGEELFLTIRLQY
jgi:uncharacterized protein (DUF2141 family)